MTATPATAALVTVRALTPCVGSYKCRIEEADRQIEVHFTDEASGETRKRREGRKRYALKITADRRATRDEMDALKAAGVFERWTTAAKARDNAGMEAACIEATALINKPGLTVSGFDGAEVVITEAAPECSLPVDVASDLAKRGLVEIMKPASKVSARGAA